MLRKRILPLLGFALLFVVGQMVVRGAATGQTSGPSAAADPNCASTSEMFKLDDLDFTATPDSDRGKLIRQFGYAIFLVMILGIGAFYFTRKLIPRLSISRGKDISVIETISLGPNKTLHLVEVGENQRLLLGSTTQSINLLAHVGDSLSEFGPVGGED